MRVLRVATGVVFLLTSIIAIGMPAILLAQDKTEGIELTAVHSKLTGTSGESFVFDVTIKNTGSEARSFDLMVKGPKDWSTYVTPRYAADKRIEDIYVVPGFSVGEVIQVHATTPFWLMPEPGSYDLTLEAISGEIMGSITLQVIVTARYDLSLSPAGELYSTKATAGKESFFSVEIKNMGTDTIHNITLSSDKPKDWNIEFPTEKVDALEVGQVQTVDVKIRPQEKAIAGDYQVTLSCSAKETKADDLKLRVTVATPSLWGWVGVAIIVIVVVGLGFIMMRFSRR